MSAVVTDIRCPIGAESLMGKLVGDPAEKDVSGLSVQLHCRECTKDFRRLQPHVLRVLHMYSLAGVFESTQIVFRDGAESEINLEAQASIFKLSTEFKRGR